MLTLTWPVEGPITQLFGEHAIDYSRWGYAGHNGIDFGVSTGTPVKAAADGAVYRVAYETGGYGNYVVIDHGGGFLTYYAHLYSQRVKAGGPVEAGDVIGYSGSTGATTGPHLHFGLKGPGGLPGYKGYLDPGPYLVAMEPLPGAASIPLVEPGSVMLAFQPGRAFRVIGDQLYVRSGPGREYDIKGSLHAGDEIQAARLHVLAGWVEMPDGRCCALALNGDVYLEPVK